MKKILATIIVLVLVAMPIMVSATAQAQENTDIQISISKAAVAPVIDGKLDADSYAKIDIKPGDLNLNSVTLDLTKIAFDAYYSYDDTNVYILLSGDSKYHYSIHTQDDAGNLWDQSCIQISLSDNNTKASGQERLEMGLARNNDGQDISNVWAQGNELGAGVDPYEVKFGENAAIAEVDGRLNYEVAIPWKTFLPAKPATGEKFGFNFMYVWSANDTDVREKLEFSSGCDVSGKNADLFAQVTVTDNVLAAAPAATAAPATEAPAVAATPDAATPAVVAVAPATTTAAQTGDSSMLILIAVIAVAAVGFVVFRKKAAK